LRRKTIFSTLLKKLTINHILNKVPLELFCILTGVKGKSKYLLHPSDVGLYNRLTVFHEFHVLDKASKDKVMTVNTFDVNTLLQLPAMRQALSIDCPAELHLVTVLVKVKKISAKRPRHDCVKTRVSLVKANMVYGRKAMMLMMIPPKSILGYNLNTVCF